MPRHRFTDTRDRIEKAAMRLFVAQGVRETSVRDIARAVDISEGALYRHFVSKEQLVWTIFERHYVEFARQLQTLAGREGSARAKVAAMIREFCRAHDENPTLFRFLLFVQHGQLSRLAPETVTPVDVIRNVLRAAIASREIPEQHPDTFHAPFRAATRQRQHAIRRRRGHQRRGRMSNDGVRNRMRRTLPDRGGQTEN